MSVTYDETVIVEFANRLYARSTFIVVLYLALGAALGAAVAAGFSLPLLLGGCVGAVLGGIFGNERAFALRLMAQTALCQLQIERNTRTSTGTAGGPSPEHPGVAASLPVEKPKTIEVDSDAEAKALVKRAQDHQYSREFSEAIALYEEVVTRFPESKQATFARMQLKNLQ
jgi:hypothetical protein